jgi:hypothetical protein
MFYPSHRCLFNCTYRNYYALELAPGAMLFLLLLCSRLVSLTCALQCFFPDGNVTTTDIACQSDTASSACCGEGGTCYSNGLCEYTDSLSNGSVVKDYQRSSCTDRTWAATECFNQCLRKFDMAATYLSALIETYTDTQCSFSTMACRLRSSPAMRGHFNRLEVLLRSGPRNQWA